MNRICWWLVDKLSQTLDANERNAVRGDFAELGLIGFHALRDLLGLIARRQGALWKDWRSWLAVIGIAVPVGLLLTLDSRQISDSLGRQLWTEWRYGVRYETGLTATGDSIVFICQSLALIASSWISGFVLGSLSRRTLWINAALFYLSWLVPVALVLAAALLTSQTIALFPRMIFNLLPSACLFVLPSAWGMLQGLRHGLLTLRPTILLATVVIMFDAPAIWTGGWYRDALITWSQETWHVPPYPWQARLLPLALMNWPLAYLVATAILQRRKSAAFTSG